MGIESKPAHLTTDEQASGTVSGASAPAAVRAEPGEERRFKRLHALSDVVVTAAIVLVACYLAKLPLVVLMLSVLLAFMLAPIVDFLQRMRVPRAVGALVAVLLLIGALYAAVYFSYSRAQQFMQEWPRYSGEIRKMAGHLRRTSENIQKTAADVVPATQEDKNAVKVHQTNTWGDIFSRSVGPITEAVFISSFIPFLVFFMLTWQEHVRISSVLLFHRENRQTAYVTLGLISSMIRSFIVGNVLVGLFMSAVSVAVFGVLGIPFFYFIGFISGFLSLVPYAGVLLALLPPIVAGLGHLSSTGYLIVMGTVFGLHLFALNVLYPKFLGSRLQLNPLAVTLALLFWGWLWGAMGLILAIPITAALKIILDHNEQLRPYGTWLGE